MTDGRRKAAERFADRARLPPGVPLDPDIDSAVDVGLHRGDGRGRRRGWSRPQPRLVLAVAVGGFLGGVVRDLIGQACPTADGHYPTALFAINTSGAFLLALLLVLGGALLPRSIYLRPLIGTGFLGAYTTFSSVVTATDLLFAHHHLRIAAEFLTTSLLAALAAAWLGLMFGRAAGHRSPPPEPELPGGTS